MAHPRDGWQGKSAAKGGNHNLGGNIKSSGGYHTKGYDDGGLVFKGGTEQGEPQFEVRNQSDLDAGMRGAVQAGEESAMSDRGESVSGAYAGPTAGEKAAAETPDYGTGSSSTTVTPAAAAGAAAGAAAAKTSAPGTTVKEAAKKFQADLASGGGGGGNRKDFGNDFAAGAAKASGKMKDAAKAKQALREAGAAGAVEAGREAAQSTATKGSGGDSSRVPYPPPKFTGPPAPMEEDAGSFLGKAFKSVKEHFSKENKQTKSEPVKQNRPKSNPNYKD